MDYLVSCNHLVKIGKVYMLPFCGEIKMNITSRSDDGCFQIDFIAELHSADSVYLRLVHINCNGFMIQLD